MTRYRLNNTKYVLKWPKKHLKVPKFNKITLSTLYDPPPLRLIHIFKINNIPLYIAITKCLCISYIKCVYYFKCVSQYV